MGGNNDDHGEKRARIPWRLPVTSAVAGRVYFDALPPDWDYAGSHSPALGGEFFLENILQALDSAGEWYVDRSSKKIYFWAPGGGNPADGTALVRRRTTVFNLTGRKDVNIDGLTILGARINLSGAMNCVVQNCKIHHGNHTIASGSASSVPQSSIHLDAHSKTNLIYKNDIQWGAAFGIMLMGTANTVDANYIGNFNYLGSYACPVYFAGTGAKITRNEIFNGGRDLMRGGWFGAEVAYNDRHHSSLINDDCGAIYTFKSTFGFTRIHHNWIHDSHSRTQHVNSYKSAGIYLDNSSKQLIVDHNVLWNLGWTCIQINWEGEDLLIYNNTLWSNPGSRSKSMGRWVNGYELINVQVHNSLANEGTFVATAQAANSVMDFAADPFTDFTNRNFTPVAGNAPVDAGMVIPGYTDGFSGSAPDCGAYENGAIPWKAGPLAAISSQRREEPRRAETD